MNFLQGVVQGLTEFLPVSSSGHLLLFEKLLDLEGGVSLIAFLHLGTFFAVLIFSFKRLLYVLSKPRLIFMTVLSTIPAGLVGIFFDKAVESAFDVKLLPITFSISALFLGLTKGERDLKGMDDMNVRDAIMIGLSQAFAVLPGISRSGMTISTAILLGYRWEDAMYYSFILSLPVTFGAGILQMEKVGHGAIHGFMGALIFGFLALFLVKHLLRKGIFYRFGYYLVALSIVVYFGVIT